MAHPKCSDEDFIRLFTECGATETAKILNITIRNVQARRQRLEQNLSIAINSPKTTKAVERKIGSYARRLHHEMETGTILVGSDAHVWPGELEPAQKAFIQTAAEIKPDIIVLNGDVLDGARISRHPPLQWSHTPTLHEELDAVDKFLDQVRLASPKSQLFWILGNHDCRMGSKLSIQVPEFANVMGTKLIDHFPHWTFCFSLWVNDSLVIKHRFKGGLHATFNNTLYAGRSVTTGHLHALRVTPFSDYNGITKDNDWARARYGTDSGTLSNPYGDHAAYTEDNPLNHRSGFVLHTFVGGELLIPEMAMIMDQNRFQFRGQVKKIESMPIPKP